MASAGLNTEEAAFLKRAVAANPELKVAISEADKLHHRDLVIRIIGKDGLGRKSQQRFNCKIVASHIIITNDTWYELVLDLTVREVLGRRIKQLVWGDQRDKPGKWFLFTDGGHDLFKEHPIYQLCIY